MTIKPTIPPCPGCGTNRNANARAGGDFYCAKCQCLYDADPDEGSDYSDRDPSVRLIRAEEERIRNQNRTRARRAGR
jgi:hypothetical protein